MSRSRQGTPLRKNSPSPPRVARRETEISENSSGNCPSALSRISMTCASPWARRLALPAKMKSSIRVPRSACALCSPSTQRIASQRLLLPLPLGPTMAVTPGWNSNSVRSAKVLKPASSSRFRYTAFPPPMPSRSRGGDAARGPQVRLRSVGALRLPVRVPTGTARPAAGRAWGRHTRRQSRGRGGSSRPGARARPAAPAPPPPAPPGPAPRRHTPPPPAPPQPLRSRLDERTSLAVAHDLSGARPRHRNHRQPRRHRLDQDDPLRLRLRGEDEKVASGHRRQRGVVGQSAGEADPPGDPQVASQALELPGGGPVPNNEQIRLDGRHHLLERPQHQVDALLRGEAADRDQQGRRRGGIVAGPPLGRPSIRAVTPCARGRARITADGAITRSQRLAKARTQRRAIGPVTAAGTQGT